MSNTIFSKTGEADIAFIFEGSYPFVTGGVSSWAHNIIQSFPEYKFAVVFLGTTAEDYDKPAYVLPENVTHFEMIYLFPRTACACTKKSAKIFNNKYRLSDWIDSEKAKQILAQNNDLNFSLGILSDYKFMKRASRYQAWDDLVKNYIDNAQSVPFLDYFWNCVALQTPIWNLIFSLQSFPKVKVLHTASTGYAGILAALLGHHRNIPILLTEHGIYTQERRIELWQYWLKQRGISLQQLFGEKNFFQQMWIRFFELLSQLCYETANPIISLYHAANKRQIEEGAKTEKTMIIPNGVNIEKFAAMRNKKDSNTPPVIAFIGRIATIKDVKTIIRAFYLIVQQIKSAQLWLVGSGDEEPEYVNECEDLIEAFDLADGIVFTGWRDVSEILPKVDLVVLSSMSEGMPLTILESFAAGIPVVSTDVGSCSELVYGVTDEDRKIGAAGAITEIGNPEQLASEVIKLLANKAKWEQAQKSAIARVEKFYSEEAMVKRYKTVYENAMRGI